MNYEKKNYQHHQQKLKMQDKKVLMHGNYVKLFTLEFEQTELMKSSYYVFKPICFSKQKFHNQRKKIKKTKINSLQKQIV